MSMWRKTLVYLGLVEEPDEYDELPERMPARGAERGFDRVPEREPEFERSYERRPERPAERVETPRYEDPTNVRRLERVPDPGGAHVRPMPAGMGTRVQVVAVSTFDEGAAEIGRQYRVGSPVLFDMADADGGTARRILDFVSGVTFAAHGRLTKMGGRAFLVVPDGVELPLSERDRLASMGYGRPEA